MTEAEWENLAVETLVELDWPHKHGTDVAPGSGERIAWDDLVIPHRFAEALRTLNPDVPAQYLKQAMAAILSPTSQDAITENHRLHGYLVEGYRAITYIDADGQDQTPTIRLVSADWAENDWLCVNQLTLRDTEHHRRLDVVLYCNGLPVSIVELKKATDQKATASAAHAQLRTYLREFPMAFRFCAFTVASDGIDARYGTPFTPSEHFGRWNVDDAGEPVDLAEPTAEGSYNTGLEIALFGLFNQERFLQLVHGFITFTTGENLTKMIAKPHQYFAVSKAVGATVQAVESNGKAGVVWHTQGSGKSLEMVFYTRRLYDHPKLLNPTVVVITDRNELDGQLFAEFDRCEILPEKPEQITRRTQLRQELSGRTTGGTYFTTLQKFGRSTAERDAGADHPLLSDRRNIVVIVDEAHRSHYDDLDGYAKHLRDALPHATLIAFTGTPVSLTDRNTRDVFGDYIDIYDLTRAVEDGATVPVSFEPRLIKVGLAEVLSQEVLDAAADEATAGLDDAERARIERDVAVINAVYGAPERLAALAQDIVEHWQRRRDALGKYIEGPGKALVVCSTRQICADLYTAITALRPDWHTGDDATGTIKVVYSGDRTDEEPISLHVRRESQNQAIKNRLRDPDDELQIVIVKDMMLTGYDSPPLHTLYLDRPLRGALLMQTLARVNRTFRGKADGLLVSYAPLVENLRTALAEYTVTDQATKPMGRSTAESEALAVQLIGKLEGLVAGYDWRATLAQRGSKRHFNAVTGTVAYLRSPQTPGNQTVSDQDGEAEPTLRQQFRTLSAQLARAWALAGGASTLADQQPVAGFFEDVRVVMAKFDALEREATGQPTPDDVRRLLQNLIDTSVEAGQTLDVYAAAGMPRPSLSDLGPQFVEQTRSATHPDLAVEALRALVAAESVKVSRHSLVRQRAFSERVTELMAKYTNGLLTSAEVIAEMVAMAKDISTEAARGARFEPELTEDELAFYDAVATNESAVLEQGEGVLAQIARELVAVMQRDVRTDWTVRDDVRAKLRSSIKRLLVKYDYPPDQQLDAIKLVLEQMEAMAPRYAQQRGA